MTVSPGVAIVPIDERALAAARARQDQLVKPPGSLGRLEDLACWLAAVSGTARPVVDARVVVAAAAHRGAAAAVAADPAAVSPPMRAARAPGQGAVTVLAREAGAPVVVVDAGVRDAPDLPGVRRLGLAPSANLAEEPALTPAAVDRAIDAGRTLAAEARAAGATILAGGELGIANTTPGPTRSPGPGPASTSPACAGRPRSSPARSPSTARRSTGRTKRCAGSAAARSPSSRASRSAPASRASATSATG